MSKKDGPKFYVASKVVHWRMWQEFKKDNNIIATWIDRMEGLPLVDGVEERTPEEWVEIAQSCMDEAARCDVLVFYARPGERWRGAFMEIGAALGAGARVHVVVDGDDVDGRLQNDFGEILLPHPNVREREDLDAAFKSGWTYWEVMQ